jgi:probable rRNA maturation factor
VTVEVEVVKAVPCPVAPAYVRRVLAAASGVAGRPDATPAPAEAAITVRITGDRELRRLNREFLGEDQATDVLSFPAGEPGGYLAGYLGDVAVSWPAVERQAREHGHAAETELSLLCVHGYLHLLGWDHATAAEERAMWAATRDCLAAAGVDLAEGRLVER